MGTAVDGPCLHAMDISTSEDSPASPRSKNAGVQIPGVFDLPYLTSPRLPTRLSLERISYGQHSADDAIQEDKLYRQLCAENVRHRHLHYRPVRGGRDTVSRDHLFRRAGQRYRRSLRLSAARPVRTAGA